MAAKVLYTPKGSDAATMTWPNVGPVYDRFQFSSGTNAIPTLIGYANDGSITFADGRAFPQTTPQGSTLTHTKG
jgi:hypothetical protein